MDDLVIRLRSQVKEGDCLEAADRIESNDKWEKIANRWHEVADAWQERAEKAEAELTICGMECERLVRENACLRGAFDDLVQAIRMGPKASIGSINNTYTPQIGVKWFEDLRRRASGQCNKTV